MVKGTHADGSVLLLLVADGVELLLDGEGVERGQRRGEQQGDATIQCGEGPGVGAVDCADPGPVQPALAGKVFLEPSPHKRSAFERSPCLNCWGIWWTWSRANHSPPPNSVNKPNLGPNWSDLPFPVMRTECVNELIGDLPLTEIGHELRSTCRAGLREVCC